MALLKSNIRNITHSLIPLDEMVSILLQIFPDTIITNLEFRVIGVGEWVTLNLGYSEAELKNKNVNILTNGLQTFLKNRLINGFFDEQQYQLYTKKEEPLLAGLSAFYAGLFSDFNRFIVIRFRNLEEGKPSYNRFETKTAALDRFIYQASHNLRGPLASIKGLARFAKNETSKETINCIIEKIREFSETLDNRLHKLTYLAEADKAESPLGKIDFNYLDALLKKTLIQHSPNCRINLKLNFEIIRQYHTNETLLYSLLVNLSCFLASHVVEQENNFQLEMFIAPSSIEISIKLHGFSFSEETRKILTDETHGYAELLKRPDLIYCYATHKIIFKLKGSINFNFLSPIDQAIIIYLPNKI